MARLDVVAAYAAALVDGSQVRAQDGADDRELERDPGVSGLPVKSSTRSDAAAFRLPRDLHVEFVVLRTRRLGVHSLLGRAARPATASFHGSPHDSSSP